MLEGKELEGKFEGGEYSLDVDRQGSVTIASKFEKDLGAAKVAVGGVVETNIFKIAELITKKTETQWDDKALATLKSILGIK